jgi:hypothetical protein
MKPQLRAELEIFNVGDMTDSKIEEIVNIFVKVRE